MEKRFGAEERDSKIVVITGAESTGKSELTLRLAAHLHAPYIPEYAREYVENLDRDYNYSDVEIIARKQVSQLHSLISLNPPLILADTWLIITRVWFEEVFGRIPGWLNEEIKRTKIDLFLVCDTDLPWIPDPVRENGGERRQYLQNRYIELIRNYRFSYRIVTGTGENRFRNAVQHMTGIQ